MTGQAAGLTLQVYMVHGRPDRLRVAQLDRWDGRMLLAPRAELQEATGREELSRTCVYLLRGEGGNRQRTYIGHSDRPSGHLPRHETADWWNELVAVSSIRQEGMDVAQARYLGARLAERAEFVNRTDLVNSGRVKVPGLPETEQARMNHFFDGMLLVFGLLGVGEFADGPQPAPSPDGNLLVFEMSLPGGLGVARGAPGGRDRFTVFAGSHARAKWEGISEGNENVKQLHQTLLETAVLVPDAAGRCRFTKNYLFDSASAAAKVVAGAPRSLQGSWKIAGTTISYSEWRTKRLPQEAGSARRSPSKTRFRG